MVDSHLLFLLYTFLLRLLDEVESTSRVYKPLIKAQLSPSLYFILVGKYDCFIMRDLLGDMDTFGVLPWLLLRWLLIKLLRFKIILTNSKN